MASATLKLIASGWSEKDHPGWWRRIADRWPAFRLPPTIQGIDLIRAASSDEPFDADVALIRVDPGSPRTLLLKVIDRLHESLTPSVLLAPDEDQGLAALQSDGVIVLPHDAAPDLTASVLAALLTRQPVVDALGRELHATRLTQGGMRDEIDRMHEELQLAANVQKEFLPASLPNVPGLEIGLFFRPCGYVSGDIYDVVRLDEHRSGFFLADAVGHGVPAALMTMVLSRAMRLKDNEGRLVAPADALARVNETLLRRNRATHMFATAVCGVIDTRDYTVTLAGAGHPPPLRVRRGQIETVETEGGLLGVFPDGGFTQATFQIAGDETLVIYSDGFETAFPGPKADPYGRRLPTSHYLDHFRSLGESRGEQGLTGAVGRLAEALDAQAGSLHQVDDLTALAIAPAFSAARRMTPIADAA